MAATDEIIKKIKLDTQPSIAALRALASTAKKELGTDAKKSVGEVALALGLTTAETKKLEKEFATLNSKIRMNEARAKIQAFSSAMTAAKDSTHLLGAGMREASDQAKKLGASTSQIGAKSVGIFSGLGADIGGVVTAAKFAAAKIQQIGGAIIDLAQKGARLQDLRASFSAMGGSKAELDAIRDSVNGMVSESAILKMRNLAVTMQIPKDEIADLARIAGLASRATGESLEFMFESIVRGSARESALILDNLGIVMKDVPNKVGAELKKLGTTMEEATSEQSKRAFLNVVKLGAAQLESVGSFQAAGASYQQAAANLEDFQAELGILIDDVLKSSGIFDMMGGALEGVKSLAADLMPTIADLAKTGVAKLGSTLAMVAPLLKIVNVALTVLKPPLLMMELTTKAVAFVLDLLAKALDVAIGWLGKLADKAADLVKKIPGAETAIKAFSWALDGISDMAGGASDAVKDLTSDAEKQRVVFDQNAVSAQNLADATAAVAAAQTKVLGSSYLMSAAMSSSTAEQLAMSRAKARFAETPTAMGPGDTAAGYERRMTDQYYREELAKEKALRGSSPVYASSFPALRPGAEEAIKEEEDAKKKGGSKKKEKDPSQWGADATIMESARDSVKNGINSIADAYRSGSKLLQERRETLFGVGGVLGGSVENMFTGLSTIGDKFAEQMQRIREENRKTAESFVNVGAMAVGGIVSAMGAAISGSQSFSEALASTLGQVIGAAGVALGELAGAQLAIATGQWWLAPIAAAAVIAAANTLGSLATASFAGSGGGGGSGRMDAAIERSAKKHDESPQIVEFRIQGMPRLDGVADEMLNAVERAASRRGRRRAA